MIEFLFDLIYEGWLPHPFTPHLSEKCAWCGATADRAIHDRDFARDHHLRWGTILAVA